MKLNATSAAAACIAVGLAGFLLGKITGGSTETSGADQLLSDSERMVEQRRSGSTDSTGSRFTAGKRPIRPGASTADSTFDEKLDQMESIVRGENALDRGRAMLDWIDSLAPEEFEDAVARFRGLGLTEARMGEYAMLLTAWAEVDPLSALTYTTENTRGGMATGTVLTAWAARDPEAAIAWAKTNHEGDDANPYMTGIIRGLVATNPVRATELLQGLPFSRERGQALSVMVPHLMEMGPEYAQSWIAALGDDRLRDGATGRFAEEMAKQDPAGTATWLLANLGDNSTRSVDEVFEEWAKVDQASALASFEQLPEGEARSRALRGMVTIEARENPQAAAELMNRFPEDRNDRMVMHFVWNSFGNAPEIAMTQTANIQDERRRNRMYERALDSWLDRDKAAAQQWINSANLPDTVLKSLSNRDQP
jgi:hypothetical protein